jgi:sulfide:quinone oxidoreductase
MNEPRHDVLVVGGGNGGLSTAAHLLRRGCRDVGLIEPADVHVYKPLQHYVAAGLADPNELTRPQRDLVPDGVRWHRTAAVLVDPQRRAVLGEDGVWRQSTDLVLAPGARLDWDRVPGAREALERGTAVSSFLDALLDRTRERIGGLESGRAIFELHGQPASGRETALKPLFFACDTWRRSGALERIEVVLVHAGMRVHPVAAIADEIERHLRSYGVQVRPDTSISAIEGEEVVLSTPQGETRERFDLVHLHPPYAAPELLAASGLDSPSTSGFLDVDPETMQHRQHPRIWGVGDACDLGDARTGGALRHQVKVLVENIRRSRTGAELQRYDGYTVAPVATSRRSLSFGEYDRALRVRRSLPVPDEITSTPLWYLLDRYLLPQVYWHRILKGRL